MVAVWPGERLIRGLLNTAAVLLIAFPPRVLRVSGESVFLTLVFVVVLSERQEGFFQPGAGDFEPGERGVQSQQFTDNRLGAACMNFQGIAIFVNFGDARNPAHGGQRKASAATNALAAGFRFDFIGSSCRYDSSLIDHGDAVGESIGRS